MRRNQLVSRAALFVVQELEKRVLLAAVPADVWVITGDDSPRRPNDVIVVEMTPGNDASLQATVNGIVTTRPIAGLDEIQIGAGRGNDTVNIELGDADADVLV